MAYRNGNYAAFYVSEPFSESNLGANSTRDFVSYNLLRAWKGADSTFPYNDSHAKNYNVRDGSDWEKTLKPRIHGRLNDSKNIVLFLSSITKSSRALREEVTFGIDSNSLPVVVVYPEFSEKSDIVICSTGAFRQQVKNLWDKLPAFRDRMAKVPTLHVPMKKALVRSALSNSKFMANTAGNAGASYYPC
jgi:hypothetical protein